MKDPLQPQQAIHLLGAFRALNDNALIRDLSAPRTQSLLAYLILHADAPQSRQRLSFVLWPDSTEKQARTNLRKCIYHLRSSLPDAEECLTITRSTCQWKSDAPYTVDVLELERLLRQHEQGLVAHHHENGSAQPESQNRRDLLISISDLYTNELLLANYEEWIEPIRSDYARRVRAAIEALVDILEKERDYARAVEYARKLLGMDVLDENVARQLMRLQLLNKDRAGAISTYQQLAAVLQEELEVEPAADTEALYRRIVAADTDDLVPSASEVNDQDSNKLVGRLSEWEQLRQAWQDTLAGNAHFVAITGEAGIGKSRLARELLHWTRQQGYLADRSRSYAAHGALSYAPVTDLLRQDTFFNNLHSLDKIWLSELSRLLPELQSAFPDLPAPAPMNESWQRQRFFDALANGFMHDKSPILLLFDDLQWCDQETMEWISFLLNRYRNEPILVLATVRTDEIDSKHPYFALESVLRHSNQLIKMPLSELSEEETATLATQVAAGELEATLSEKVYDLTGGNPLFVVETVRARQTDAEFGPRPTRKTQFTRPSPAQVPQRVHAVIQGRLEHLSSRAQSLCQLSAVIGHSFCFFVARNASDMDEDELANAFDELIQRRILLDRDPDAYDFTHDRIRDVAYAEVSNARRRLLHSRVADSMIKVFDYDLDSVSGQIAQHYLLADRHKEAVDYLIRAGDRSADQFANQEANSYYTRALEYIPDQNLPRRYSLINRKLRIAKRTKDTQVWNSWIEEAEHIATSVDDAKKARRLAEVATHKSNYAYQIGNSENAVRFGKEAIEWAVKADDIQLEFAARSSLAVSYWSLGEMHKVQELLEEPLERAVEAGRLDMAAEFLSRLSATGMFSGMSSQQLSARLERMLDFYEQTKNLEGQADVYNKMGYLHVHAYDTDPEKALKYYNKCNRLADLTGNSWTQNINRSNRGYLHVLLGDYATAEKLLEKALNISILTEYNQRKGATLVYRGFSERNRGAYRSALASQQEAMRVFSKIQFPLWNTWANREAALCYRALDQYEQAEGHARTAIDLARQFGDIRQEGYALMALGLVLEDMGSSSAAEYFEKAYACYVEMNLHNRSMAPLAGLARLAEQSGDADKALDYVETILCHVAEKELDKTEEGFRVYVTCYDLLHARADSNTDSRAADMLTIAQRHLQTRADSLTESEQKQLFWEMKEHRRIRELKHTQNRNVSVQASPFSQS